MSSYAPTKTLDQIYKIFVRPHMDYCDIIYHLPRSTSTFDCPINLNFMMQSLESIQYQADLAVSGAWKGSSTTKLYEELGWESLSDRRWLRRLCQFYKIQNDLTPSYLTEPIPQPRMFLYFNLGLASVHSKAIRKIITFWTLHRQYVTVEAVRKIPFISLLNVPYFQLSGLI